MEDKRNNEHRPKFLIGPDYFEKYVFVLRIVLVVTFIGTLIGLTLEALISGSLGPIELIGKFIESIISGLLSSAAIVTIIFAVFEYKQVNVSEWKLDMPTTKKPKNKSNISLADPLFGIFFNCIFFGFLFIYPEYLTSYFRDGDTYTKIPIFQLGLDSELKWLIVGIFVFGILKEVIKLVYRKWSLISSSLYAVFSAITLILLINFLLHPGIWNPVFLAEVDQVLANNINMPTLSQFVKGLLTFLSFVTIVDVGSKFYRGLNK